MMLQRLRQPQLALLAAFIVMFGLHLHRENNSLSQLVPETLYQLDLMMSFEPDDEVEVSTYLPLENDRQQVIQDTISARLMDFEERTDVVGRYITWWGDSNSKRIRYQGLLSLRPVAFDIAEDVEIPQGYGETLERHLQATTAIPTDHPEIVALWNRIKPDREGSIFQVLKAIHDYVYGEISVLPFKGFTDSLTALRLGSASCNGKSRLFISLARLNNIPARLVGGIILDGGKKKTSHQWVEVYVEGHWIPFDPTNGHFASLPSRYAELYRGDEHLFRHTANINFDYFFDSSPKRISPALYRAEEQTGHFIPNAASLLQNLGLDLTTTYVFLLFPIGTLLVAFLRNIIGLRTLGIFMPILIASACVYTGFLAGMIGLLFVLLLAVLTQRVLGRFNVLKIPRLAATITVITIASLAAIPTIETPVGTTGMLVLFPAVIISFTADRIHAMAEDREWGQIAQQLLGTLLTISLCYLMLNSFLVQGLVAVFPEILFLVLALLLFIGNWSGIRLSELIRFRNLHGDGQNPVLGLNRRNLDLINQHNDSTLMRLAKNKLATKERLAARQIACPPSLAICRHLAERDGFLEGMKKFSNFVIKPNRGAKGNGILILTSRQQGGFLDRSGNLRSDREIAKHVSNILTGSFSPDNEEDQVYIEPIIEQHETLDDLSAAGLCDLRIILQHGDVVGTMLRIPTLRSGGRANLHKGAVGAAINDDTGTIERAMLDGKPLTRHPDTGKQLVGIEIPHWDESIELARRCYSAVPLGYMGIDICIDRHLGPLVLEINGRPGLEIQNIRAVGLGPATRELAA